MISQSSMRSRTGMPHSPSPERPAPDCRSARVGFQRVDRVIDRIQ